MSLFFIRIFPPDQTPFSLFSSPDVASLRIVVKHPSSDPPPPLRPGDVFLSLSWRSLSFQRSPTFLLVPPVPSTPVPPPSIPLHPSVFMSSEFITLPVSYGKIHDIFAEETVMLPSFLGMGYYAFTREWHVHWTPFLGRFTFSRRIGLLRFSHLLLLSSSPFSRPIMLYFFEVSQPLFVLCSFCSSSQ